MERQHNLLWGKFDLFPGRRCSNRLDQEPDKANAGDGDILLKFSQLFAVQENDFPFFISENSAVIDSQMTNENEKRN
jgi:hypothetical protein